MIRKTLTILSLLGLLLSVGLWGASYFNFVYRSKPIESFFMLQRGSLGWRHQTTYSNKRHVWYWNGYRGLRTRFRLPAQYTPGVLWWLPLWMPTVASAAVLWVCSPVAHHRRRKRKKLGLCLKCGYDLRASKDRCPECGTATK